MAFPLSDAEHATIRARIEDQQEIIVGAAIRVPLGYGHIILTVERPGRHGNLIYAAGRISGDRNRGGEHGFITNHGRFVDRAEAGDIVHITEQGSTREGCGGLLFSEDMWNDWDVFPSGEVKPEEVFGHAALKTETDNG